jgi:hypothetical protein
MPSHRHHVVSRGYQRFFAQGERVLLIDKRSRTYKEVGTRATFVESNFNSWRTEAGWDDSLEKEWQRIEGHILPRLRVLLSGPGGHAQREAAKVLAALHFARSYSLREMQLFVGEQVVEDASIRFIADPVFVSLYNEQFGHTPGPGEIENYIADRWHDLTSNLQFIQERTVHAYHFAKDFFGPLRVQFLYAHPRIGFVLGDTPLIVADPNLFRVGIRDRIALGDAERIWMPLTRRCSMSFWTTDRGESKDAFLTPADVQKLNWLSWRAASRFLICHPNEDPRRALLNTPLSRFTIDS